MRAARVDPTRRNRTEYTSMSQDARRAAGHPTFSTTIPVDLYDAMTLLKDEGHPKAQILDEALRAHGRVQGALERLKKNDVRGE